jgi:hypothetical protein
MRLNGLIRCRAKAPTSGVTSSGVTPDEAPSLETWKFSLYFSGSYYIIPAVTSAPLVRASSNADRPLASPPPDVTGAGAWTGGGGGGAPPGGGGAGALPP